VTDRRWRRRAYPTYGQSREARAAGEAVASRLGAREFRRRASLVVRCDGQPIVHVTYLDGRPMVWHRGWGYAWLDMLGPVQARCQRGHHVLSAGDLADRLPPPAAPAATWGVSHPAYGSRAG
jgi:hypothetical protein